MSMRRRAPLPRSILSGENEGAFDHLPETVIGNLRRTNSENARLWNTFYPRPGFELRLADLLSVTPLWGSLAEDPLNDRMQPYFWGFHPNGERLEGLADALQEIDGTGPRTEIDLILRGDANVVVIEAKNLSTLGRCGRFQRRVCPEVQVMAERWLERCRYWDEDGARFEAFLDFGPRPGPGAPPPPCARHYQMARTLLVGEALARRHAARLHVWVILPKGRWPAIQRAWLDFADRIRSPEQWRRLRVVAWDDLVPYS